MNQLLKPNGKLVGLMFNVPLNKDKPPFGGNKDFASTYTQEVSLEGALTLEALMVYAKQATGEKFLINPNG